MGAIQLQNKMLSPSGSSLLSCCLVMTMLNAELKLVNCILTQESTVSRCVKAKWRAVAKALVVGVWNQGFEYVDPAEGSPLAV